MQIRRYVFVYVPTEADVWKFQVWQSGIVDRLDAIQESLDTIIKSLVQMNVSMKKLLTQDDVAEMKTRLQILTAVVVLCCVVFVVSAMFVLV